MAHTLLFPYRCVAELTQRLFMRLPGAAPRALVLLFACATSMLAGAGCFTHPINRKPVISQVSQTPGPTPKGQPATFTAIGSDPDQDQLTWTWTAKSGDCPMDWTNPANWPKETTGGEPGAPATYVVDDSSLTKSPLYCVWVFATDRYGAMDARNLRVAPTDNAPVVTVRVAANPGLANPPPGPIFPAYSTFQFSALASDADNDPLTYNWKLDQRPSGSNVEDLIPCPGDDSDTLRCFTADLPGTYGVSLTVSDGTMTVAATPAPTVTVAGDAAPCIDTTDPMFSVGAMNKAIPSMGFIDSPGPISVVTVYDDGNPYPPRAGGVRPSFTWFKSKNDDKVKYVDNVDYFQLTLSKDEYQLGDYVNVRLEVRDQNPALVDSILAGCGDDAEFCAAPTIPAGRTSCWVRVSWRIQLTLWESPLTP